MTGSVGWSFDRIPRIRFLSCWIVRTRSTSNGFVDIAKRSQSASDCERSRRGWHRKKRGVVQRYRSRGCRCVRFEANCARIGTARGWYLWKLRANRAGNSRRGRLRENSTITINNRTDKSRANADRQPGLLWFNDFVTVRHTLSALAPFHQQGKIIVRVRADSSTSTPSFLSSPIPLWCT